MENKELETTNASVEETQQQDDSTNEVEEGIELTDTSKETQAKETEKVKTKTFKELLKDNPEYQKEFDDITQGRVRRALDKQKELTSKEMESLIRTRQIVKEGMELEDDSKVNETLVKEYAKQGIKITPQTQIQNNLSDREIEILADADVKDIVNLGETKQEIKRLSDIGVDKLSKKDRTVLSKLLDNINNENRIDELINDGVDPIIMQDEKFTDFVSKFNKSVGIKEIYNMYSSKPKEKSKPVGDLENAPESNGEKLWYTNAEIDKLSKEDLMNSKIMERVTASLAKMAKNSK